MPAIPTTLDGAVKAVLRRIPESMRKQIRETSNDKLAAGFHHFGGMSMRNSWGLWTGSKLARWFAERGITHADDMSGIIFDAAIAKVKNKGFDFEAAVERYQAHWLRTMGVKIPPAPWLK